MSLRYEPVSEPLQIYVEMLFGPSLSNAAYLRQPRLIDFVYHYICRANAAYIRQPRPEYGLAGPLPGGEGAVLAEGALRMLCDVLSPLPN